MFGIAWWICGAAALGAAGGFFAWARERRERLRVDAWNRELCDINAALEQRLTAHTRDLENAVALAEAASRAKSEFLANMSHEIRTPLNAVIGLSEVVLRTELSEFQRDHLRTVQESGDALLHVINDILDFSKIEAGKLEMESVPFALEDAVCDALKSMAIRAQQRGLELTCYVDPKAPHAIRGDPARFRQVLVNLVNNAITYTERGEVFVRVTYEPAGRLLHVAVLDSGVGIPPEQLERIFDSFQQADTSSTRRYGGTGLGLTISKELVELMGGRIRAASEVGVGSTFSFDLVVEEVPKPPEVCEREAARAQQLADEAVLIVDDNTTNRTVLGELLRQVGVRPVLAESAQAGFERLLESQRGERPIGLVVSDVKMPGEDGYALVDRIRARPELEEVRIVLLTSALEDADPSRGGPAVTRLMKPVKHSELLDALVGDPAWPWGGERERALAGAAAPRLPDLRSARVLLVEDSVANQKLVLAILQEAGYEVSVAENGRVALEKLAREPCDAVLMDVHMPEMDGYEATRCIRAVEGGGERRIPIIAMTANALQGDREKCLLAGMDDYLAKPVRREELVAKLDGALDRRSAPARALD